MDGTLIAHGAANQVELSSGRRVGLPVRYIDWTGVVAHFPAPVAAIRRLLPSRKLEPVQLVPGTAILSLAAIECRRLDDLSPYNEVAVMTPVRYMPTVDIPALPLLFPSWFKRFGFFVRHMPVTTQDVHELGVKVWGYPKLIADIGFEEIDNIRRCRVRADGREMLTLDVEQAPAKIRRVDFAVYTVKDASLLRHRVETEGLYSIKRLPGGASFSFGDHPIGQELEALHVGKRAIARVFGSNVRSLLHEADESFPL